MCDGHKHDHEHHDHDHPHPPQEEVDAIEAFIADPSLAHFVKVIHRIYSPVDLYDHNEEFKKALDEIEVVLVWGTYASHIYTHAYTIKFDTDPGCTYSVWTNHDLDVLDLTEFSWTNHDLFAKDKGTWTSVMNYANEKGEIINMKVSVHNPPKSTDGDQDAAKKTTGQEAAHE